MKARRKISRQRSGDGTAGPHNEAVAIGMVRFECSSICILADSNLKAAECKFTVPTTSGAALGDGETFRPVETADAGNPHSV